MGHIFLSYSHNDIWIMRYLKNYLINRGSSVWSDEKLKPGTPVWQKAIESAIDDCGCVVVVFSESAKKSEWVIEELNYAKGQGKLIIPLLASGNDSSSFPFGYSSAQYIDIRPPHIDSDTALHKLTSQINEYMKVDTVKWHYSANLYWLGHDLNTIIFYLAMNSPQNDLLRAVRQSQHHANELNIEGEANELLGIYYSIRAMSKADLTKHKRDEIAHKIAQIIRRVGDTVNAAQPGAKRQSQLK
jgi:hypothetical protein